MYVYPSSKLVGKLKNIFFLLLELLRWASAVTTMAVMVVVLVGTRGVEPGFCDSIVLKGT